MPRPTLAKRLLNRGNSRERQFARMLARGRVQMSPELRRAYSLADQVIKDISGAGAPMTGSQVHTDTYSGTSQTPKHNSRQGLRKTRLKLSYFRDA